MIQQPVATATLFGLDPLLLAAGILVLAYLGFAFERINRAIISLLGAGLMMVSGVITQTQALAAVDFNVLAVMAGMMTIVAITRTTGLFQYLALQALRLSDGRPSVVLVHLTLLTAVLSAAIDNVAAVMLLVPVTLSITDQLELPPYPFLFSEIVAANIGGTATQIGSLSNLLIGSAAGFTFNHFLVHLAPIVVVVLVVQVLIGRWLWGRSMRADPELRARVLAVEPRLAIADVRLLRQSIAVGGSVLLGLLLHSRIGLEVGAVALIGAAVLILLETIGRPIEDQAEHINSLFAKVEWVQVFFLIGLFIIVAGVDRAGLLSRLAAWLASVSAGDTRWATMLILWGSALASAFVDGPMIVTPLIPTVRALSLSLSGGDQLVPLWVAFSLGIGFGGLGSLVGAALNLAVAGTAERAGIPFAFTAFLKLAFPLMLVSVLLSTLYLWLRYLL